MFLIQDRALAELGHWDDVAVVERSQSRSESACKAHFTGGSVAEGPIGGCRGADIGGSIHLFVDPEAEAEPNDTAPHIGSVDMAGCRNERRLHRLRRPIRRP
ncbi:hypothetical protein [Streptomyces sp. OM5714]|uniref:hypothetical protein n=1 Tax=Streptomyces sp. OM5714 TaxID=2602736 RepID=UPI0013D99EA5|nr:hypothetical protein [Streptomyces sp. OM5714]